MAELSKEAEETMKKLGHDVNQVEGGDIDESEASLDSQTEQPQAPVEEPKVEESQEDTGLDQEEVDPNDKTWQSKYDKTTYEKQLLEERLAREEKERQFLYQTLTGMTAQQQPQQQTQEKKEPVLNDFINTSDYNSLDALDPSTASGQAYQQFQEARMDWKTEQNLVKFQQKQQEERKSQVAMKQAKVLADRYPEFRNALTGQPDMTRISEFMDELSNSDQETLWADLYAFKTGKTTNTRPMGDQIGRKANQVQSVSSQSGVQTEQKPLPKSVQQYRESFGDNFEYPEGAEFE